MNKSLNILITGYGGFVAPYIAQLFLQKGHQVHGAFISDTFAEREKTFGEIDSQVKKVRCDLTNPGNVFDVIKEARPDRIIHLAAQSHIPTSIEKPELTWEVNVQGTVNIFEAVQSFLHESLPRILIVGSALEYGSVAENQLPILEDHPLNPENPYAETKVEQEKLTLKSGLPVQCVRSFNHLGPGQRDDFVASSFARQMAKIKLGKQNPVIRVGNLEPYRDFLDVRDVARAYQSILDLEEFGQVFNICSGKESQVYYLLETLINVAQVEVDILIDRKIYRPAKCYHFHGSNEKLKVATGWSPLIPIEQTLEDMYYHWFREEGSL